MTNSQSGQLHALPLDRSGRTALRRARLEARRNGHQAVELGHLLLGLCEDAPVVDLLAALMLELAAMRAAAVELIGIPVNAHAGPARRTLSLSAQVRAILLRAADEARALNQRDVESAYVLLGLVGMCQESGADALEHAGLEANSLRALMLQRLVLGAAGPRGWAGLCAALEAAYPAEVLWQRAEQLKLHAFDSLLHTNLVGARQMARFIGRLGLEAGLPRISALGLLARGDVARQSGKAGIAASLFQRSGVLFLVANDRVGWARAWAGRLIARTEAGQITDEDLAEVEQARQALHAGASLQRQVNLEQNIAVTLRDLGRYAESLAAFDAGLARLAGVDGRLAANLRAMLLMNKANTLLWLGELAQAGALHTQARAIFVRIGNTGLAALEAMNLSLIERLRGHVHEALQLAGAAVEGLLGAGMPCDAALALTFRADTLLTLNRYEEALADATRAVTTLRPLRDPCDLAAACSMRARALSRWGDDARALEAVAEGEAVAAQLGRLRVVYPVTIERALLLLAQGRAAEAREAALSVLRTPVTQETRMHRGMAQLVAGAAALELGQIALAQAEAEATIQAGEQLDAPELIYRGHLLLARCARRQGALASALAHYDRVAAILGTLVGDLVQNQVPEFLEDKDDLYLEALLAALETGDAQRALNYLEQSRAYGVQALYQQGATGRHGSGDDAEIEALRTRHRYISGQIATLRPDSPGLLGAQAELKRLARQIRDQLEARATRLRDLAASATSAGAVDPSQRPTMLIYALAGDDLVIFVQRQGSVDAQRITSGARALRRRARMLQLDLDTLSANLESCAVGEVADVLASDGGSIEQALADLWPLLIAPVQPWLPPDGAPLTIVPHGIMHALPLAALFDGTRYLAERWVLHCMPSSWMPAPAAGTASAIPSRHMLALGYSDGGHLPHAAREAREVAALLGGEVWTERKATGARLRRHGPGRPLLHLAAHGVVRLDEPGASFIQLAGGPFVSGDVRDLDLRGCRLVTLSACRTGLGRTSGGDEQIGLVRAFGHAGAQAVLATLWRVADESTRAFMRHLYTRLAQGATPAEALRGAQITFLRGADQPAWRHPYFWGGFQLMTYVAPLALVESERTETFVALPLSHQSHESGGITDLNLT